jgi:hypothetical protein
MSGRRKVAKVVVHTRKPTTTRSTYSSRTDEEKSCRCSRQNLIDCLHVQVHKRMELRRPAHPSPLNSDQRSQITSQAQEWLARNGWRAIAQMRSPKLDRPPTYLCRFISRRSFRGVCSPKPVELSSKIVENSSSSRMTCREWTKSSRQGFAALENLLLGST